MGVGYGQSLPMMSTKPIRFTTTIKTPDPTRGTRYIREMKNISMPLPQSTGKEVVLGARRDCPGLNTTVALHSPMSHSLLPGIQLALAS